jgi:hypothetical protein
MLDLEKTLLMNLKNGHLVVATPDEHAENPMALFKTIADSFKFFIFDGYNECPTPTRCISIKEAIDDLFGYGTYSLTRDSTADLTEFYDVLKAKASTQGLVFAPITRMTSPNPEATPIYFSGLMFGLQLDLKNCGFWTISKREASRLNGFNLFSPEIERKTYALADEYLQSWSDYVHGNCFKVWEYADASLTRPIDGFSNLAIHDDLSGNAQAYFDEKCWQEFDKFKYLAAGYSLDSISTVSIPQEHII